MQSYSGMKVLIMGLGINGGGLESALYLARKGAEITVTDLRDEKALAPSIEKIENMNGLSRPVRYVLGRHEIDDFKNADMVIKNPGVRPDSPYLAASRCIETDISLFLAASPARLSAVTGSKGKSATASALHWVLSKAREAGILAGKAFLGGNITVSPLSFLDELRAGDDVVLELSSWQLGDLRGRYREGVPLLKPRSAVLTAILPDHQDRYGGMDLYVADKRVIYQGQDRGDITIACNDEWGRSFLRESRARGLAYSREAPPVPEGGGWIGPDGQGFVRLPEGFQDGLRAELSGREGVEVVPARLLVPGGHQKNNLLAAALALIDLRLSPEFIRGQLGNFPGIEHRLEFFYESGGIRFYNDTAATIPEAAAAAVEAFQEPVILVCGGTDKNLDFSPLAGVIPKAKAVVLLSGTGSVKLRSLLDQAGIPYHGPFDAPDKALDACLSAAAPGDNVVLSPGCASFGMFRNEFDRGRTWKETVRHRCAAAQS
ncbi:MAG: UDP-N-acetylmuramoyl-L-alanine--D-glutamate ligase [Treponema sp.]|jgi:UDP-N-acetylmuramoylalanine--D-glutamate ligase|nr:UDP-N-acetylmuramoyl-L-alanine--D-glutamate ligase [Treponema sp.]